MTNTIFDPDRNEIIFSTCVALLSHIRTGMEKGLSSSGPDVFSEEISPLESTKTKRYRKATRDPDVEVLYSFITKIVDRVDLEETCIIMALAFVERIMVYSKFDLLPTNWRRVVMTSFVVAAKVFYDEVVWNQDFKSSFPNYDLSSLHKMEMCMLEMIDYNVIVRQGLYAKYYYELRSISEEQNYTNLKKRHQMYQVEGWEQARKRTSSVANNPNREPKPQSHDQVSFLVTPRVSMHLRRSTDPNPKDAQLAARVDLANLKQKPGR